MRHLSTITAALLAGALTLAAAAADDDDEREAGRGPDAAGPLAVVERLMDAFNAHDVDAMIEQVADDVGWYAVDGGRLAVEAKGADALRAGMTGYFRALPSVSSRFDGATVSGSYVAVREIASWEQGGQTRSQASLAVYHVADGKVASVWYYPAER